MTTVWAAVPQRRERAIVVQGHATGSDKVCAAVSGILYALGGYLTNAKGVDIQTMRMEDAHVCFKWTGGKRFFRMAPLHHHYELGGWEEVKVVRVFTLVTLALCLLALAGVLSVR